MKKKVQEIPSIDDIKAELHRIKYRRSYRNIIRNTLYTLITVAAIAVLVATLWMPVLQTHGSSMTPTLRDNNIVVSV
ncbi:MAG: signal peptidase I, partial [Clostridia bacterium]|nr:signal peptidase I [Clostridia bacterium]